jgi:hypothetical protein
MGTPAALNPPPPVQSSVIPAPLQPSPSVPSMSGAPLPDPVFVTPTPLAPTPAELPPFPNVPVEKPAAPRPASLAGDGATGAFWRPAPETMPVPSEAPSGPSPYTQIISRAKPDEAYDAEAEPAPPPAGGAGRFAAPAMPSAAMPKLPAAAPPVMPRLPPPPRVAPPPVPMPRMTAPPAPKVPKSDAPASPPVSMWPLILTLTVLFFLAVILVLFFVFRH